MSRRKYIKLSPKQKDEIRRLTQLANRRIKAADRAYKKKGLQVLPRDVVGKYQVKEKWHTKNTPISRSIKFTSQKEYRRKLHELRQFEHMRPGIKEYSEVQRNKTKQAIESSLGMDVPGNLEKKIDKMSAPELSRFWDRYSEKASKLGLKYSSEQAMQETLNEVMGDDIGQLISIAG